MKKLIGFAATLILVTGCAAISKKKEHVASPVSAAEKQSRAGKLAKIAVEMLDPSKPEFNPAKGRAYLEYSLREGNVKNVELPANAMLEILRNYKVAEEKSRTLEQQLEIIKEIDLTHEEEL